MKNKNITLNPGMVLKNYLGVEIGINYLIMILGNLLLKVTEQNIFISRYLVIFVINAICSFFILRSYAKKSLKENADGFKKNTIIATVIVAIIIVIYGLVSVANNIKGLNSLQRIYYEQEINEARMSFVISAVVYLVIGLLMAILPFENYRSIMLDNDPNIPEELRHNKVETLSSNNYGYGYDQAPTDSEGVSNQNIDWNL